LRAYLLQPEKFRYLDPELSEWLGQVVGEKNGRRTARIETSEMLGFATFQSRILTDNMSERKEYYADCAAKFADCDLVFLDPDNGIEISSVPRGRKNSCKYVYWEEVRRMFSAGASVLIYQHFKREERVKFTIRMAEELRRRTSPDAIFSFRTPHVLFLLAAHERHTPIFRKGLAVIHSNWGPKEIVGEEHTAAVGGTP
jgi:hypothetical protein